MSSKNYSVNAHSLSDSDEAPAHKIYSRIKTSNPENTTKKRCRIKSASDSSSLNSSDGEDCLISKEKKPTISNRKLKKKRLNEDKREVKLLQYEMVINSDDDSDMEISNEMNYAQEKVANFLKEASESDLLQVQLCSQSKVAAIIKARPFKNWKDIVYKFNTKILGTNLLNNVLNLLKVRCTLSNVMKRCLKVACDTEQAISNGKNMITEQPRILTKELKLKNYQIIGVNWLAIMYKQNLSAILADEMGLGKTIQIIAFLSHIKETEKGRKIFLVVAPTSTLENWANEFAKWSPKFQICMYYGSQEERKYLRTSWFKEKFPMDVIITSYHMLNGAPEEKKMFKIVNFHYCIFDEAHLLKNMNTQRYSNLLKVNTKHRILLTGTPLQNNLLELMSLLNFVMPNMFTNYIEEIKTFFKQSVKSKTFDFEQEQLRLAKRIMAPFVLRRLKKEVLHDLPRKTREVIFCQMDQDHMKKYQDLKCHLAILAKDHPLDCNHMSSLMKLRKLANHPLTLRYKYNEEKLEIIAQKLAEVETYKSSNADHILEDLIFESDYEINRLIIEHDLFELFDLRLKDDDILTGSKFNKLDELLPKLRDEGHRVIIFSQFLVILDLLEEYMRIRKYKYLRLDGQTQTNERQDLIDNYNEDSSILVFLCTTKAGGVGINLTTADTVIIYDIDYNPHNDKQAEDRCHRVGQTKPVHIIRLLCKDTIDEYIYQIAENKLLLEQELTGTNDQVNSDEKQTVEMLLREALSLL